MGDEARQDLRQCGLLVVSQRRLIDDSGLDEQVHVRVDESRDNSPSAKVNDPRLRPPETLYLVVAADRRIRSPSTATASAVGCLESLVRTFAPVRMRSG
jgi:hypothetical protein